MKLEYSKEAINDLSEIRDYISGVLKNRTAAKRIVSMILSGCRALKQDPLSGFRLDSKIDAETDLRVLVCENWLAFYNVSPDAIVIVRVLDGRSDYINILFRT